MFAYVPDPAVGSGSEAVRKKAAQRLRQGHKNDHPNQVDHAVESHQHVQGIANTERTLCERQ